MIPWVTGDTITAERLNGMQKEPLIVNSVYEENPEFFGIDKSYNEIKTAINSGRCVFLLTDNSYGEDTSYKYSFLNEMYKQGNEESFGYGVSFNKVSYIASDPNERMHENS